MPRCVYRGIVGWRAGCMYRVEPGVWLRWGATDHAVYQSVTKDYWGLLLSLSATANASKDASDVGVRVVLDAGANIGLATRLFHRFFGPNTTVVALEAQADNHAMARRNNEGSGALVLHAALGPPRGPRWLTLSGGGPGKEYSYKAHALDQREPSHDAHEAAPVGEHLERVSLIKSTAVWHLSRQIHRQTAIVSNTTGRGHAEQIARWGERRRRRGYAHT